jgi:hypothetical protein
MAVTAVAVWQWQLMAGWQCVDGSGWAAVWLGRLWQWQWQWGAETEMGSRNACVWLWLSVAVVVAGWERKKKKWAESEQY